MYSLLWFVACSPPDPTPAGGFDPDLAEALQGALSDAQRASGAPGAALLVQRGDQRWIGTSGWSDVDARVDVAPDDPFRIGSITKVYTAVALVSLAHEGQVDLDAPVAALVPGAPHGGDYSLHQVLAHLTGLIDYAYRGEILSDMARPWSPEELLEVAGSEPLAFEPGTQHAYSNTNYAIAGLAIEAITGQPWQEEVRSRVLQPLGLQHTGFPSIEPAASIPGYFGSGGQWLDVTDDMHPSVAGAGGEIVANAADVATFAEALFAGQLVDDPVLEQMTTAIELPDGSTTSYGLGVMLDADEGGPLLGHSGSTMGFQSRLSVRPGGEVVVVSLVNDFLAEADELDAAARAVLADAGW